jgi:broad specificity phosphatase PhoE
MHSLLVAFAIFLIFSSCSRTIYVVRHAEKVATTDTTVKMSATDPPLSEAGKVRAIVLREELKNKKITRIYSTNYLRNISTAQPLAEATGIKLEIYNSRDSLNEFIQKLRDLKENILVVGHSNTVDDIVNRITGETNIPGDLADSQYDNLFILKQKGDKWRFERRKFGYPSSPE